MVLFFMKWMQQEEFKGMDNFYQWHREVIPFMLFFQADQLY